MGKWFRYVLVLTGLLGLCCGTVPVKRYYLLNYVPEPLKNRSYHNPYPFTVRVKELGIEKAYDLQQIVYRTSAYELGRYFYRSWAVSPTDMLTDLVVKHMDAVNLVSRVVRRLDQGTKPDYELSGMIEAIEQYESEDKWFAHLAWRLTLQRLGDGRILYSRHFDNHKLVAENDPMMVVRELSRIADVHISQAMHDIDLVLAREYGVRRSGGDTSPDNAPVQFSADSAGSSAGE